jgi:hypothetical protein
MARQGARGIAGQKGERGPPGIVGKDAPILKNWKLDRKRYIAIPVMSDGEEGPALDLRGLFEQFRSEVV